VKRSGVKRSGVKWSGVKRSGVKRSGVKRGGVKRPGVKSLLGWGQRQPVGSVELETGGGRAVVSGWQRWLSIRGACKRLG